MSEYLLSDRSSIIVVAGRIGLGIPEFGDSGRWVEADLPLTGRR